MLCKLWDEQTVVGTQPYKAVIGQICHLRICCPSPCHQQSRTAHYTVRCGPVRGSWLLNGHSVPAHTHSSSALCKSKQTVLEEKEWTEDEHVGFQFPAAVTTSVWRVLLSAIWRRVVREELLGLLFDSRDGGFTIPRVASGTPVLNRTGSWVGPEPAWLCCERGVSTPEENWTQIPRSSKP
jgi:hypothetical protein